MGAAQQSCSPAPVTDGTFPVSLYVRLLTGYAVTFNLRHNRSGHLFQNRYKSIVCDDEAYLLELVRYIHLNPLRAQIVDQLEDLNSYRWSGHRQLIGKPDYHLIEKDARVRELLKKVDLQTTSRAPLSYNTSTLPDLLF